MNTTLLLLMHMQNESAQQGGGWCQTKVSSRMSMYTLRRQNVGKINFGQGMRKCKMRTDGLWWNCSGHLCSGKPRSQEHDWKARFFSQSSVFGFFSDHHVKFCLWSAWLHWQEPADPGAGRDPGVRPQPVDPSPHGECCSAQLHHSWQDKCRATTKQELFSCITASGFC